MWVAVVAGHGTQVDRLFQVAAKKLAAKQAVALGKPWVLDPVGCGATPYRTRACLDMLHCRPTVVRGNGSEIMALSGAAGRGLCGGHHFNLLDETNELTRA